MKTGHKGRRREYQTIRHMEKLGYWCVRAAASKGVFDVVAVSRSGIKFIQVKCNDKPGPAERKRIQAAEIPEGCERVIHVWKDGITQPEVYYL